MNRSGRRPAPLDIVRGGARGFGEGRTTGLGAALRCRSETGLGGGRRAPFRSEQELRYSPQVLREIAEALVPSFADLSAVLARQDGVFRTIVTAGVPPSEELAEVLGGKLDEIDGTNEVAVIDDFAVGLHSGLLLPLPFGVLLFATTVSSSRSFGPADIVFVKDLGAQLVHVIEERDHPMTLAVENARFCSELRESRAMTEQAVRRKDEFLAILGHELRNPLSPIVTALEVLRMRGVEGRELQIIDRQVRHLTRLVDDLLDVSRIAQGKVQMRRVVTALAPIVQRAIDMAAPLMEERGQHLRLETTIDGHVDGDATRLTQVFVNLLSNAAKYTPAGGHVVVRIAEAGDRITVQVSDDGIGIDPELLPHLFQPFVQSPLPLDRAGGGLGLGLAIVRSVVELHGGTVSARSAGLGKGTTFEVSLPLVGAVSERPPSMRPNEQRKRILVVDDNIDAAELLAEFLRDMGHDVVVAADGPSALRAAKTFHPDAAVLDIGLPVMDGYELARRLRGILPTHARFVAVTGYGQEKDRAKSREAGFASHLVKPVDLAAVQRALG